MKNAKGIKAQIKALAAWFPEEEQKQNLEKNKSSYGILFFRA